MILNLEKPLYCKALRTIMPSKEDANKGEDSEEKEEAKDTEKEKKVNLRIKMTPTKRIKTKINIKKHLIN